MKKAALFLPLVVGALVACAPPPISPPPSPGPGSATTTTVPRPTTTVRTVPASFVQNVNHLCSQLEETTLGEVERVAQISFTMSHDATRSGYDNVSGHKIRWQWNTNGKTGALGGGGIGWSQWAELGGFQTGHSYTSYIGAVIGSTYEGRTWMAADMGMPRSVVPSPDNPNLWIPATAPYLEVQYKYTRTPTFSNPNPADIEINKV